MFSCIKSTDFNFNRCSSSQRLLFVKRSKMWCRKTNYRQWLYEISLYN